MRTVQYNGKTGKVIGEAIYKHQDRYKVQTDDGIEYWPKHKCVLSPVAIIDMDDNPFTDKC